MKLILLSLTTLATLAAISPCQIAGPDQERIQGAWTVVSAEFDGKGSDELSGMKFNFSGQSLIVKFKEQERKATYKLDPTKKPKELDLISDEKGDKSVTRAIYLLEGDSLKICSAENTRTTADGKTVTVKEGKRPTAFDSKQGGLMILKRDKKSGD